MVENNSESQEFIEIIFSYITQISAERFADDILRLLADMGRQLVRADRCTVWVVSKDKKTSLDQSRTWCGAYSDLHRFGYCLRSGDAQ